MSTQQDKETRRQVEAMGRRIEELETALRDFIGFVRSIIKDRPHSVGGAAHDSNVRLDRYGNPSRQSDY